MKTTAYFIFIMLIFCQSALAEQCRDSQGNLVTQRMDTSLNDIAMATIINREPYILFNPYVPLSLKVNDKTITFFAMHECAHHVLGHTLERPSLANEKAADCWAIKKLYSSGDFDDADVRTVQGDIAQFGRGDWTHLRGQERAINLRSCLRHVRHPDDLLSCSDRCLSADERCRNRCRFFDDACWSRCEKSYDRCDRRCDAREKARQRRRP